MTIRTRKFLGAILLLMLCTVWALLGMAAAQMPWIAESGWRQAIYYVVVGFGLGAAGDADRELDAAA